MTHWFGLFDVGHCGSYRKCRTLGHVDGFLSGHERKEKLRGSWSVLWALLSLCAVVARDSSATADDRHWAQGVSRHDERHRVDIQSSNHLLGCVGNSRDKLGKREEEEEDV
jgi:hypothetical protein